MNFYQFSFIKKYFKRFFLGTALTKTSQGYKKSEKNKS